MHSRSLRHFSQLQLRLLACTATAVNVPTPGMHSRSLRHFSQLQLRLLACTAAAVNVPIGCLESLLTVADAASNPWQANGMYDGGTVIN